jgi:hypothetical protein
MRIRSSFRHPQPRSSGGERRVGSEAGGFGDDRLLDLLNREAVDFDSAREVCTSGEQRNPPAPWLMCYLSLAGSPNCREELK